MKVVIGDLVIIHAFCTGVFVHQVTNLMTADIIQAKYDLVAVATSFGACAEANAALNDRLLQGVQALQDRG